MNGTIEQRRKDELEKKAKDAEFMKRVHELDAIIEKYQITPGTRKILLPVNERYKYKTIFNNIS
ncbi:MAG: hypothetical protein FWE54_02850 [Methanimicrococcus sp.]|nr:hypothetical protein [Methanimicrococcus sp.]